MTTTKRISLFFFLFFLALSSCKKKDNATIIEGQYKPSTVTTIDEVVMYSHQGKITQPAVIKSFFTRKNLYESFTFDKKNEPTNNFILSYLFDFSNNGTVYNSFEGSLTQQAAEIVSRTPTYLDIAAIDSTTSSFYSDNSRCQTLGTLITSPIPQKKEYQIPTTSGYSAYYKYRPMMRFEILNGQLYLPVITYLISYTATDHVTACHNYAVGTNATFNQTILQQLKPGDTILYQTKRTMLIKQ